MTGGLADGARRGPAQAQSASTGESWAIVLAAGGGTRVGERKQFADLAGRPMLEHTLCSASTACDGVVVVLPAGQPGALDGAHRCSRGTGAPPGPSRCARAWPRCRRGRRSMS